MNNGPKNLLEDYWLSNPKYGAIKERLVEGIKFKSGCYLRGETDRIVSYGDYNYGSVVFDLYPLVYTSSGVVFHFKHMKPLTPNEEKNYLSSSSGSSSVGMYFERNTNRADQEDKWRKVAIQNTINEKRELARQREAATKATKERRYELMMPQTRRVSTEPYHYTATDYMRVNKDTFPDFWQS